MYVFGCSVSTHREFVSNFTLQQQITAQNPIFSYLCEHYFLPNVSHTHEHTAKHTHTHHTGASRTRNEKTDTEVENRRIVTHNSHLCEERQPQAHITELNTGQNDDDDGSNDKNNKKTTKPNKRTHERAKKKEMKTSNLVGSLSLFCHAIFNCRTESNQRTCEKKKQLRSTEKKEGKNIWNGKTTETEWDGTMNGILFTRSFCLVDSRYVEIVHI